MALRALATAVTATLGLVAPHAHAAHPELIGRVGLHDAYTISLRTPRGARVTHLRAGTYTFVIHDYSKIHNFALGSQTENKRLFTTGIPWIGTRRYTLTLAPGRYAFACSAHPSIMNGTFTVG
jgi:hypothetical protein